ncbi:MAG TPA: EAL domain-containing protein [Burkholderiales bacterium]|nr:EAL domain-containing protein [Burkholderiales bacterium]
MSKKDKNEPANTQVFNLNKTETGVAPSLLEKNLERREQAVSEDEIAMAGREKTASARENASDVRENATDKREIAADLREEAVNIREDAADLREKFTQTRENETRQRESEATQREHNVRSAGILQTQSEDQVVKLQQTAEQLLAATLETKKMAEQVQLANFAMQHLAEHDALTDLPNRLLLQKRLEETIAAIGGQERQLAIFFLDLDQFKHINDSLGHVIGDQLLKSVANRLSECVDRSDTISRQGGDEFVILLQVVTQAKDAELSAKKILAALALPHHVEQLDLHITASIGISIFPDDGLDGDTLIKNADTAMYHAKATGRNNYQFFNKSMNTRAVERQSIEGGLRRALERQEFVLYYQPKINLRSRRIVGAEALIRWQHPQRGLLSPSQFITIAEDCGLILSIDRWVLRTACLQAQVWQQMRLPLFIVAVNISAPEFRAPDFLDNLKEILSSASIAPDCIELELTESILMQDAETTIATLRAISEIGVKLAVDDFGTGYSSLSYLRKFPIDTLKIDQSFVNHMISNPDDAAIVSAVIGMAKNLRLRVIAEGVETPEQFAALLGMGCDEGQGYYFGRPMTAPDFQSLLMSGISIPPGH